MESLISKNKGNRVSPFNDRKGHELVSSLVPLTIAVFIALSGSSARGQSVCVQPPSGAIAWWSFDETSGPIAADRVGDKHPGAWANGPVPAPGEVRGALRFNGTNYVTVQNSDLWHFGANNFTVELWANFDAPPGGSIGEPGDIFIGNDDGPGNRNKWFFAVGGGYLYFHINGPTLGPMFFPLVPFSPVVGQWYHLAVVRMGSTYTVFINGVPVGSATNANVIPNPNAPLTIGQAENLGFMKGRLDEVTVYNRALAPEEIMAIYNAGTAGKCVNIGILRSSGGDSGAVTVHVSGTGFAQGASLKLAAPGFGNIVATNVTVMAAGTALDGTLNLVGQPQGGRNVIVTNPDGVSFTLDNGFTIEQTIPPQVWVDVIGIPVFRPGTRQSVQVLYGNTGNVDVSDSMLWVSEFSQSAALSGAAFLSRGVHMIRVSYFQGPRFTVALVLAVGPPGTSWRSFNTDDFTPPKDPVVSKYSIRSKAEWVAATALC